MNSFLKRTWAQIDLDALEHNYRVIRGSLKKGCRMMCVIKADAYGHGAVCLAREYERLGTEWFAVSNLAEAIQLRDAGISKPVLVLGYTPAENAGLLAQYRVTQAILSTEYAEKLSHSALKQGVEVEVHLKLDTGMSRIGLLCQEKEQCPLAAKEALRICRLPGIQVQGAFTHFAVADEAEDGREATQKQYDCFMTVIGLLRAEGVKLPICHCSNSGAVLYYPEMQLDMVRCGIILYGLLPSSKLPNSLNLRPVMELKSIVSLVKEVPAGTMVSYGHDYIAQKPMRIATVPIGYADGYSRLLSGRAEMLVRGKRAPVIGRVCMDQLMLDVTDVPDAEEGDTVTVFGRDGEALLPVEELATLYGTIHYEIVCLISKRVPRLYYRGGRVVDELDYICP